MNTNVIKSLTFGANDSYNVAIAKLPEAVKATLMQRTFSHIMGNEAAAVNARLKAETVDDGNGGQVARYNDAELATAVHDWRTAKIAAMLAGDFSLRVVGPRLSEDETILRDFAKQSIIAQAEAKKKTLPKASDKATWDAMVDQFLATPRLRALADAELTRRKAAILPDVEFDIDSLTKKAG